MPRIPRLTKFELITLGQYIDNEGAAGSYITSSYETKYTFDLIRKGYLVVVIADANGNPLRIRPTMRAFEVYSREKMKWGKLNADTATIRDRAKRAIRAKQKFKEEARQSKQE